MFILSVVIKSLCYTWVFCTFLQEVGVQLNANGAIKVDECLRTSVDSIFAVGDVTARVNLTPVALMEAMAFVRTAFGPQPVRPDYGYVPSAVFCVPPLATVG